MGSDWNGLGCGLDIGIFLKTPQVIYQTSKGEKHGCQSRGNTLVRDLKMAEQGSGIGMTVDLEATGSVLPWNTK